MKILITNNPMVKDNYNNSKEIMISYEDTIESIFIKVRDYIHKGYLLISHPLAGSVKPYQNPYRSVLIKKGNTLDYESLKIFENSKEKYNQFSDKKVNIVDLPKRIAKDYQLIDFSLIENAIKSYD